MISAFDIIKSIVLLHMTVLQKLYITGVVIRDRLFSKWNFV